jgi:hypothetical protein
MRSQVSTCPERSQKRVEVFHKFFIFYMTNTLQRQAERFEACKKRQYLHNT